MYETQTCEHHGKSGDLHQPMYTNEGITWWRTHIRIVLVGQPKHESILEKKGFEIENTRFGQRNQEANKHHITIIG